MPRFETFSFLLPMYQKGYQALKETTYPCFQPLNTPLHLTTGIKPSSPTIYLTHLYFITYKS
jgi:hypothetical protein